VKKILVLENDFHVRNALARVLSRDYVVICCETSTDAEVKLATGEVDYFLTEFELNGGINGVELIQQSQIKMPEIKMALMSAGADIRFIPDGVEFLAKPFDAEAVRKIFPVKEAHC